MDISAQQTVIKHNGIKTPISEYRINDQFFIDAEQLLGAIYKDDKEQAKKMVELIPNAYFRIVLINGKNRLLMDSLATSYLCREIDDYELFRTLTNKICGSDKRFTVNMFCTAALSMIGRMSNDVLVERDVETYNRLQQDLMHEIENGEFTDEELLLKAKELKLLREERRKSKNALAQIQSIKQFMSTCSLTEDKINSFHYDYFKVIDLLERKVYKNRACNSSRDTWKQKLHSIYKENDVQLTTG